MTGVDEDVIALTGPKSDRHLLLVVNTGAVLVAALYFGRELLVPLVLASLLAFVLAPVASLMQRARLPRVPSVMIAVLLAFAVIGSIGLVVGRQATMLASSLPTYEATILAKWTALADSSGWVQRLTGGLSLPGDAASASGSSAAAAFKLEGASGLTLARTLAQPLLGPVATGGVVLVFTIFILLSSEDLRDRLVRLVGRRDLHRTILAMNDAARRLSRYFLFQMALNTGFGTMIGTSLWLIGLPNPVLWGILAGLMRFVPFIGSFIAVAPPLLLALAVVPGWSMAVLVLALFIGGDMIMGQIVEPLIYGHSTGLSPIAVIVATAFWAFLWGPVGLLLATPLTVCLVVIGRHVEPLAFLDVILGDSPPLEPAETFYQRALEGQAAVLAASARQRIAATSLTDYYDTVALRGLALAQADLSRDALAFERLEAIHAQIERLLGLVGRTAATAAQRHPLEHPPPPEWQADGAILCIPARGQLDDLAANMAVQVLDNAGFGARIEENVVLGASGVGSSGSGEGDGGGSKPPGARLCCLSVLEEGSSVSSIRYFVRRIQKRMPNAAIVVCLWHAERTSPMLAELRSEGQEEHLVLSAGELLAFVQALSARESRAAA